MGTFLCEVRRNSYILKLNATLLSFELNAFIRDFPKFQTIVFLGNEILPCHVSSIERVPSSSFLLDRYLPHGCLGSADGTCLCISIQQSLGLLVVPHGVRGQDLV